MLSHGCFFGALLVYYVPKWLGKKSKMVIQAHIVLGCLAVLGMLYETVLTFGTDSFLKYCGFSAVMLAIAGTGYLIMKQGKKAVKWHILAMCSFFLYLAMIIIF